MNQAMAPQTTIDTKKMSTHSDGQPPIDRCTRSGQRGRDDRMAEHQRIENCCGAT
jgi:hypothetical protein